MRAKKAVQELINESSIVLDIYDKEFDCDDKPADWPSPDSLGIAIRDAKKAIESESTPLDIINQFDDMCAESINPDLYSTLKDKIIPSLKASRNLESDRKNSHLGMCGENPVVQVGKIAISEFRLPPDETVWMDHEDGGGFQAQKETLAAILEGFYNDNF